MKTPQITFHGGAGTVTGAHFTLTTDKAFIAVDCGLTQGKDFCDECNREDFSYDPSTLDALVVTHAHLDHIGRIPFLVAQGFAGPIYSTPQTRAIAEVSLEDTVRILNERAVEEGTKPLYTETEVRKTFELWETLEYHTEKEIAEDLRIYLKDAGHILGSAMIEVRIGEETVVFTGDLGNSPAPLLREAESIAGANYLVMESVYGDRLHESVEERLEVLEDIIEDTIQRGGTLMIPAFSIERTQVLLSEINELVENAKIPKLPVFLDSPMAIKVTEIYKEAEAEFNHEMKDVIASGDDIFRFPGLSFTPEVQDSKAIADAPNPKIIIAGSGMSNGGRIVHHEKRYLSDPNSTLLIVGYQAVGSIGRQLLEGAKTVTIHDEEIPVKAKIVSLFGYSAHKDRDGLLEFVAGGSDSLKKVFLAMGEVHAAQFLAQRIKDYLGINAIVPESGKTYDLTH